MMLKVALELLLIYEFLTHLYQWYQRENRLKGCCHPTIAEKKINPGEEQLTWKFYLPTYLSRKTGRKIVNMTLKLNIDTI